MFQLEEHLSVTVEVLNEVQHVGDAEVSVQAKGPKQQVQCSQFIENLTAFCRILSTVNINSVRKALQSQSIDISS
jgi:hypothetical protein